VSAPVNTTFTIAALAFVGVRLVGGVRRSFARDGRTLIISIVRGVRWRHVWPVPFVLAGVVAAATALVRIPGLQWGWWTSLGGEGNPVFGTSSSTNGTVWEWVVPAFFMVMLVPALPLFAYAEERMFRQGAEHWTVQRRAFKVVQFGLIHALIGIPIGTALALSLGGAYFMFAYLRSYRMHGSEREATIESTRAHVTYNGLIVIVTVVLDALMHA
jgi:hypothetical protein